MPDAALRTIEEFSDKPGVVGFLVTSVRNLPVHDNQYMKLYAALEERELPLAFHSGYSRISHNPFVLLPDIHQRVQIPHYRSE